MKSKRAFLVEPGRFEIRDVEVKAETNQLLLKIEVCGLCNWELNHWKGILGECPQTLGHEWAGTVVQVGENVRGFAAGDVVTGLSGGMKGFSDYMAVNAAECLKIEGDIKPQHAIAEPLKCIVTVLRGAAPDAGDIGVVVGCGPMGLWCIQALAGVYLSGLIAVDVNNERLKLARKFGATHTLNPKEVNVETEISQITHGHMADFLIEGTGAPAVLNGVIPYLRATGRGRLVIMSSHEEETKNIDLRQAARRGLEIRFAMPKYSLDNNDDLRRAVDFINRGIFKMEDIITHTFPLEKIQQAFETLEKKPQGYLKGIVIP